MGVDTDAAALTTTIEEGGVHVRVLNGCNGDFARESTSFLFGVPLAKELRFPRGVCECVCVVRTKELRFLLPIPGGLLRFPDEYRASFARN